MRRFSGDRLLVATHNRGKLDEIAALLKPFGIACVSAADMGLPEPAETEDTFAGNARIKAHAAARATGLPALADDSGIEVDGLGGAPGVHTADWAETPAGRDFVQAMTRTWDELERAGAPRPRTARFRATMVLAWPDGHDEVFEGTAEGEVVWPMRGRQGHGYDPMFQPEGHDVTFAEMDAAEKNRISHRADAFRKLVACFGRGIAVKRISTGSPFERTMGYSRAIVKGGWCFVSGVTGYDYRTMVMPERATEQARNCMATIRGVLDEAGFAMEDIVRVQYTVTDAALVDELAPVLGEVFGEIRPAATMVIAGLIRPEMKVEIEVTAFRG
jgi:XTP/dITP diphosphohydrolase